MKQFDKLSEMFSTLEQVEGWLESVMGGKAEELYLTDGRQQLSVVANMGGLMVILGGEWHAVLSRIRGKQLQMSNAKSRGIQTDGEEGEFMNSLTTSKRTLISRDVPEGEQGVCTDIAARNDKT